MALPRPVIRLSAAAFFASLGLVAMKFVALYMASVFNSSTVDSIIGAFGGHLYAAPGGDALWLIAGGLGVAVMIVKFFALGRDAAFPDIIGARQK